MEDFCVDYFKYQENSAGFYAPMHNHTCHELVYYISGSGTFTMNGKVYSYSPNTFSVIAPHTYHDERALKDSQLLFMGFRYFNQEAFLEPGIYPDFNDHFVCRYLREMEREMQEKRPLYSSMMNAMTHSLFISIYRQYFSSDHVVAEHDMEYIRKYINEHLNEKINLQQLADLSGYSYDWFRHVFKLQTGMSITQYVIGQRLKHAATQLTTTEKSITQIALENNFSSSSQFIAQFRKMNGLTPSVYRKIYSDKTKVPLKNIE